jgi:phenylacetate-coenzyme A ligase PaaK-like adenylate-forming protein
LALQGERLLRLLQHAVCHSAYYKAKYRDYLDEIQTVDNYSVFSLFEALPVLTKKEAIENAEIIQVDIDYAVYPNISSGTTGEPFQFPCDQMSWAYRHAAIIRFLEMHQVSFGAPYGYFSGQHWRSEFQMKTRLKDWFFNRHRLSAFDVNKETVAKTYHWLRKNKAKYIFGYPSTIFDFVAICNEELKLDLSDLSLDLVVTTGETLAPYQKQYVANHLGCPVRNYYGSVEGGAGAFEGPEGFMHSCMETTHLWFDQDFRIHKTDLWLRKFPLIKFDMADYINPIQEVPGTKYKHKVVGDITGRSGEKIKLPDGSQIHPMLLNYFFDLFTENQNIRKFRFVFGKNQIELLLEPMAGKSIGDRAKEAICKEAPNIFKSNAFKIVELNEIPVMANGKHRDWVYG